MERKKLLTVAAIVIAIAVVASVSAVLVFSTPPATGPAHVYGVEGDSDWFDLPASQTTGVFAIVTDKGAPLFGVTVSVSSDPDTEGSLTASSATTDNLGIARGEYSAFNRPANTTVTFPFTASLDGQAVTGTAQVRQLGFGFSPATARVRGRAPRPT